MYGYIYLTTNKINNKKYIGKHKSAEFDKKYIGSGTVLLEAIKHYGIENFNTEILECCDTLDELNAREFYYISINDAVKSKEYYNLKDGGEGGGSQNQLYITNGIINKKVFEEEFDYYFSQGFHRGGPKQSEETKHKRAEANRGKKHPTAGAKISASLTGKKLSDAHRHKLSVAKIGSVSPKRRKIKCVETEIVYDSLLTATVQNGYKSSGCLCSCLKGNRDTAFGFHWEYIDL